MPHVIVKMYAGRDDAQKQALAAEELSPIFGDGLKDQAAAVWD